MPAQYTRMFNVGEKKAFINDLATKLLLSSSSSASNLTPAPHYHHHHSVSLLATDLLSLENLILFKIKDLRIQFLAKCLQLHANSGKGQLVLNLAHFELLTDVLRVILREANNEHDTLSVRMVYLLSDLVGTYLSTNTSTSTSTSTSSISNSISSSISGSRSGGGGGGPFLRSVKTALRKHEAWKNIEFYNTCLDESVARDKQHWMNLHGPLQEILSFDVSNEEIITLLLSFRLRAIAHAILQLQAPLHLIEGVLLHCKVVHGVTLSLEEIYEPLEMPFMLWLVDVAMRAWCLPLLAGSVGAGSGGVSSSSLPSAAFPDASTPNHAPGVAHTHTRDSSTLHFRCTSLSSAGGGGVSVSNLMRWATDMTLQAGHWACLGFSIHHELFRFIVDRIVTYPKKMDLLSMHVTLPTTSSSSTHTHAHNTTTAVAGRGVSVCLCGRPYRKWKPVGGFGSQLENIRRYAPLCLCEGCFRCVLHSRRLDMLRLVQPVGVASLPMAEIRTPDSIGVFVAARVLPQAYQHGGRGVEEEEEESEVEGEGVGVGVGVAVVQEPYKRPVSTTGPSRVVSSTTAKEKRRGSSNSSNGGGKETHAQTHTQPQSSSSYRRSSSSSSTITASTARKKSEESEDMPTSSSSSSSSLKAKRISASGPLTAVAAPPPAYGGGGTASLRYRSSSVGLTSSASSSAAGRGGGGGGGGGSVHSNGGGGGRRFEGDTRLSSSTSASSSAAARYNRRASSGGGSAASSSSSSSSSLSSTRRREDAYLTLLKEDGMEVLKHGRFGCVVPHYRLLFIDRDEVYWCRKEDIGKHRRTRGGLHLKNLHQVKLKKGSRILSLSFKERPLVVEALSEEQFEVLAAVFTRVMNDNSEQSAVVISRGKR